MKKLDEMKLAIYEKEKNGEITKEERDTLLEAAEKKYGKSDDKDDSDKEEDTVEESVLSCVESGDMSYDEALDLMTEGGNDTDSANQVYIKAMHDANDGYKETLKDIKEDIKAGNYLKAKAKITIANTKLKHLKNLVDKTPSTLSDDAVSNLKNMLSISLKTVGTFLFAKFWVEADPNDEKYQNKVATISAGISAMIDIVETTAKNLLESNSLNQYKTNAIKAINANMLALKELEKKMAKAKNKDKIIDKSKKETRKAVNKFLK